MRFTVRLCRGTTPVIVNGMHLCLGHLVLMMHTAAKNGIEDFEQLIDLAAKVFDEFDGATEADSSLPFFDRAFHYRFTGIGAWGAGNVSGMLELLFRGDDFLQVGVQVAIGRVMFFGTKGSVTNVLNELSMAAEASYKQQFPEPIGLELGALSRISDEVSQCYLSIMPSDRPVITCRIGNRAIWDNAEPMFGA
ncbi:MAG: hypothetical protein WD069_08430 [Planctomycetales bacterium]